MRFAEFSQLNEAAGTGYYTVGDSTAYNLAMSSDVWTSLAQIGSASSSNTHKAAIDKIPAGAVVAISVGADDLAKTIDSPEQIAANAASIVNYAKNKGLQTVFVLFPSSIGDPERNQQVKAALKSSITTTMLDMDGPSGKVANYPSLSSQVFTFFKPPASLVKQQPQATQSTQVATGGIVGAVSAYLKTKMDDVHRLGILANIKRESNFNPGAIGDGGTSGGLFQHHADRFSKMVRAAGGKGSWKSNWQAQVDFALSEPAGQQYLATKFRTPAEAVTWWVKHFEKPANQAAEIQKRISFLKDFDGINAPATASRAPASSAAIKQLKFAHPEQSNINPRLAEILLKIFSQYGQSFTIQSGYRSPAYNKGVGGAKDSAHTRANAVDLATKHLSKDEKLRLIQIASQNGITGIGVYDNGSLHFDIDTKHAPRRAWGTGYDYTGLPKWAKPTIDQHLAGRFSSNIA